MPTNLPPECRELEERFRAAESVAEKIVCLEELISAVPKHKGTDHLRADLRRKLSRLKVAPRAGKGTSRRASAYQIDREGAGQVAIIGPPNVGKSALLTALTNANPEVANYPYTTWTPTPGMMCVDDIQIQLIDTPPLDKGYVDPDLMDLIRRCDLVLLVVDYEQRRPTAKSLLVLVNKADDDHADEDFEILCQLLEGDWPLLPVSATTGRNLEHLRQTVFDRLDIIRVYSKLPGKAPDLDAPYTMKVGSTVAEFARSVHQDFFKNLKAVRVWGSASFDGQMVERDYVLHDGDVVELRI